MIDFFGLGNAGANLLTGGLSFASNSPEDLRPMTREQLQAYDAKMWEMMRPAPVTLEMARRMQNRPYVRTPTMTLAEWDAARAAFRTATVSRPSA